MSYNLYKAQKSLTDALRVALRIGDLDRVKEVMDSCDDDILKKQMALILARHRVNYEVFTPTIARPHANKNKHKHVRTPVNAHACAHRTRRTTT